MRRDKRRWMIGLAALMSFSVIAGMNVMASEESAEEAAEQITEIAEEEIAEETVEEEVAEEATEETAEDSDADPYEGMDGNRRFAINPAEMSDEDWGRLAMVDDSKVSTGVNIRDAASDEGQVTGCIYRGGAVEILDRGSDWSEIRSGNVWGYISNNYLIFGTDIKGMVDSYGIEGVKANWDDVHVFEDGDPNARTIYWASTGETFPLVEDQGHWLSVRLKTKLMSEEQRIEAGLDPESTEMELLSFVSIEDVTKVILVDTAVAADGYYPEEENYEEEEYYEENTSYDNNSYTQDTSSNNTATYTPAPAPAQTTTNTNTTTTTTTNTAPAEDTTPDNGSGDDYYEEVDSGDDVYNDDSDSDGDSYQDDEYVEEIEDAEEYAE